MDRALKERIIGAIVLVAVVVLIVPVFLDGPPSDGEVINEVVPLPGQSEQRSQTVVLDRDRTEPVPAPATAEPEQAPPAEEDTPEPVIEAPAETVAEVVEAAPEIIAPAEAEVDDAPVEAETAAPAPAMPASASTTGMWAVQLGSFSNQQNAEALAADLRRQGFAAFLSQLSTGSGPLHRVRIGPQKDREAAEAMAVRLENAGHKGQVVPHP